MFFFISELNVINICTSRKTSKSNFYENIHYRNENISSSSDVTDSWEVIKIFLVILMLLFMVFCCVPPPVDEVT